MLAIFILQCALLLLQEKRKASTMAEAVMQRALGAVGR
jgi:hypothetical protein